MFIERAYVICCYPFRDMYPFEVYHSSLKIAEEYSFCGKSDKEVRRMVAGPNGVIICNECVDLCTEVIVQEEAKGKEA
jgi:hypothetical protein